jgi:hypothetical protein
LITCQTTDPDVQGKKYVAGLSEGHCDDGLWQSGLVSALSDAAEDWLTAFVGAVSSADWQPGVWSPTRTNFYAATGSYAVPTIPAYQRRRKRGVGV